MAYVVRTGGRGLAPCARLTLSSVATLRSRRQVSQRCAATARGISEIAYVAVAATAPAPPAQPARGFFRWWYLLLLPLTLAVFAIIKRIRAANNTLEQLEDRGLLPLDRASKGLQPWGQDAVSKTMETVKYTEYEQLSEEAILRARKRRERDRDYAPIKLEDIELPENHPWAISDKSDELTDEIIEQRLAVKRGIPRQDLGRQGASFPDDQEASIDYNLPPRSMRSRRSNMSFDE